MDIVLIIVLLGLLGIIYVMLSWYYIYIYIFINMV